MSLTFLITTLIVVATPGTGVVYTLAAGLSRGRRSSVVAALGCTLGIVPHVLATVTGLAAVLHASAVAFQVVKFLGVAYLIYLAWTTLRDRSTLSLDGAAAPGSAVRVITRAILINILNPKLTMFFLAFLPQFVDPAAAGAVPRMLLLSGVFMLVTFVVFAGYGIFAAAVRHRVVGRPRVLRWMRGSFAVTFLALGARLALTNR
ncbi:LysE family translocator [Plantactinospora sp. GCM10030261]|uniref:LysE family translocator n=1 Tax=Plantactinospora sp. GCM10030261 TaxID=3273420 RepID=UPI003609F385